MKNPDYQELVNYTMRLAHEYNVSASIQTEVGSLHVYPPEDIKVTTVNLIIEGQTYEVGKSFGKIDNIDEIKAKIKSHIENDARRITRKKTGTGGALATLGILAMGVAAVKLIKRRKD